MIKQTFFLIRKHVLWDKNGPHNEPIFVDIIIMSLLYSIKCILSREYNKKYVKMLVFAV